MPSDGIQDLEGLGSPSRTISSAGLSSLSPLNAAARSSLSFVQPRYSISQTRRGSTHRTSFSTPTGSGLANSRLCRTDFLEFVTQRPRLVTGPPCPDPAGVNKASLVMVAES